ncbi:MAG: GerMN domain-containing protein [Lachnospiraceae bacterium]|jgi:hypothetical protein|nr:GerMN domain-containing protein [Lachnospiraceae bacterium]
MKKRILVLLTILLIGVFAFTACEKDDDDNNAGSNNKTTTQTGDSQINSGDTDEDDDDEISNEETNQANQNTTVKVDVYFANSDASRLVDQEVTFDRLTPQALIDELAKHNMVSTDLIANSVTTTTNNGDKAIILDVSSNFSDFLSERGSTGEWFSMGSVVNTFLDAYDADYIKITVDGNNITGGSADYTGFQKDYENN